MDFNVSYGYTNAKFVEFYNGKQNFKDNTVPYAPQNTLTAGANYTLPLKDDFLRSITFHAGMQGIGKIYWNEENSVYQPFYALADASISLNMKQFTLSLWAKNITNTDYDVFYFRSIGNDFLQQGKPAQFGATLRFEM